jgi:SMC interacting uncharacterized protein involved in chromosome segregation
MNIEDVALKLQETTDRSVRNEGRIKKLEEENGTLHSLATSVAVMAEQMKQMNKSVTTLTEEMEEMKSKPAERWDAIVDKIIWGIVGACLAYFLSQIGL